MDVYFGYPYGLFSGFSLIQWTVFIALMVLVYAATWLLYQKAGKPGWAAIIPFYNNYVMADIVYSQGWMFLLGIVPIIGLIYDIVTNYKFVKMYGASTGMAIGCILLPFVFLPILGFGEAKFQKEEN